MGGFSLGNSKSTNAAKSLGDDVTVNLRTIAMYMWRQEFTFPISTGTACNKVTFGESLPLLGVSQLRTYRGFSDSGCRGGRKRSRLLCQSTKITVCQKGNVLLTQMAAKNCDAIFWYMCTFLEVTRYHCSVKVRTLFIVFRTAFKDEARVVHIRESYYKDTFIVFRIEKAGFVNTGHF